MVFQLNQVMLKIVGRLSVEYCHHIHYDLSSAILTGGYVRRGKDEF